MVVGTLQIEIEIPGAASLKDKRRVVRSIKDACAARHGVSAAETGALDVLNRAVLGFACVSNSGARAGVTLDRVTERVRAAVGCEIIDARRVVGGVDDLGPAPEPDAGGIDEEMLARAAGLDGPFDGPVDGFGGEA